ncbi:hypothetical protein FEZ63_20220 [Microvirga brassicacearum]|uniref:Uncharacterized protein n=1 Tax=Microvirga brassicacearum TaxID=2580413 RepID=A0A5N3P5T5_9HYPH|nr:hypothetical protein [Microvirga brassicacearum]KAB0265073.1 hypothetical protein FEZ63_20220 [Microvirga brassicacearum]
MQLAVLQLDHHVIGTIDYVPIIALATNQGVVPVAPVQGVISGSGSDHVVGNVPDNLNVAGADEYSLLDIVGHIEVRAVGLAAILHSFDALIEPFGYNRVVIHLNVEAIKIIAIATYQGVFTEVQVGGGPATIQGVVAVTTYDQVAEFVAGATKRGCPESSGTRCGGHDPGGQA